MTSPQRARRGGRPKGPQRKRREELLAQIRDLNNANDVRRLAEAVMRSVDELRAEFRHLEERYSMLQTSIVKTLAFQFQLLDDPDARAHAAAIVRDYKFNANHMPEHGKR